MEGKQKINCNVESCKFNDRRKCECNLNQITVEPTCDCHTELVDKNMNRKKGRDIVFISLLFLIILQFFAQSLTNIFKNYIVE